MIKMIEAKDYIIDGKSLIKKVDKFSGKKGYCVELDVYDNGWKVLFAQDEKGCKALAEIQSINDSFISASANPLSLPEIKTIIHRDHGLQIEKIEKMK